MNDMIKTVWLDGIGAGTILVDVECWPTPNGFYEPVVTREQAAELMAWIREGYQDADVMLWGTWEGDDLLIWHDDGPEGYDEVIDRIQPDENGMYRITGFTFDIYDGPLTPCPWCNGGGCKSCGWVGMWEESDDVTHPDSEPTAAEVAFRADKASDTEPLLAERCSDEHCTNGADLIVAVPVQADCHIGMRQFTAYIPMCGTCHTHWQYAVSGDEEPDAELTLDEFLDQFVALLKGEGCDPRIEFPGTAVSLTYHGQRFLTGHSGYAYADSMDGDESVLHPDLSLPEDGPYRPVLDAWRRMLAGEVSA